MKIVAGSSNPELAASIAKQLQTSLLACDLSKFSNGENRVKVSEEAKGEDVLIVQSFSAPVDEHIIETLLIADALKRVGAKSIQLFIPWFSYSFQDKVFTPGEPVSAEVIARLIQGINIQKFYLLDLHNGRDIPGFFSTPLEHLTAASVFADYVRQQHKLNNAMVVSPDYGGLERSQHFAHQLKLPLAVIKKQRDLTSRKIISSQLEGNVKGKTVFVFDDAIFSGGTTIEISRLLKENGAAAVHFFATHGVFTGNAEKNLAKSAADSVVITNSIAQPKKLPSIVVLDISPILVENISR